MLKIVKLGKYHETHFHIGLCDWEEDEIMSVRETIIDKEIQCGDLPSDHAIILYAVFNTRTHIVSVMDNRGDATVGLSTNNASWKKLFSYFIINGFSYDRVYEVSKDFGISVLHEKIAIETILETYQNCCGS